MIRKGILNIEINRILSSLGHGQLLLVCDAGFPIPINADYVDLSLTKGIPSLNTVLKAINDVFITEKLIFAEEVLKNNLPLYNDLKNIFPEVEFETIPHERILSVYSNAVKSIIRTGDYNPWGNIILQSGTDPYAWFENKELTMPDFYKKRIEKIEKAEKRDMFYKG